MRTESRLSPRCLLPAAGCLLALLLTGCGEELVTEYGARSGLEGEMSVNGTSVLADMFKAAGHRIGTWHTLSPRLKERADVIVWFPDDTEPPSQEVVDWFETWLYEEPGRTLIYVGRDFDAAPGYWKTVAVGAPPADATEIALRQSEAQNDFLTDRVALPSSEDWTWFTMEGTLKHREVRTLDGSAEWLAGVDPAKVEIELNGRLTPPTEMYDETELEVLLESEGDLLVGRLEFDESQLLVVANGSFLLNLPLVNHEHRKLAAALIREVGEQKNVVFLEAGGSPTVSDQDPEVRFPTGMELFGIVPLNQILLHLAVVGIIFCFARLPIFGLARQESGPQLSDFAQHVASLGELLAMTGDRRYALSRLQHYYQSVRQEPPPPWAAIEHAHEAVAAIPARNETQGKQPQQGTDHP